MSEYGEQKDIIQEFQGKTIKQSSITVYTAVRRSALHNYNRKLVQLFYYCRAHAAEFHCQKHPPIT